jgi:hypothetical protein
VKGAIMTLIPSEHIQADTTLSVPMSFALEEAVRLEAAKQRISKAELIRQAIIQYLNDLPVAPQASSIEQVAQCQ